MSKSKTVKKDLYYTKKDGWIAFIGLTQPYERKGLMQPEQYKLFTKRKF